MTLVVGALLQDNRYQIQSVLEETDIEIVYRAVHTYLDKSVLLRQLRSDVEWGQCERPDSRAIMVRLLRFSQCQHPCLGEILDCFEEDGRVYMVLPTYGKLTMAHWLQTNGGVDTAELIVHLRSLVDIFDKFHQNGLVYGFLTPESLHYRAETNELVVAAFSWRMFLADLLGDRHRLSESTAIDIQGLAHIAYRLLTGDVDSMGHPVNSATNTEANPERSIAISDDAVDDTVQARKAVDLALSEAQTRAVREKASQAVQRVLTETLHYQVAAKLTPTAWFTALEQSIQGGKVPAFVSGTQGAPQDLAAHHKSSSSFSKSIFSPIFRVAPSHSGGRVLESVVLESVDSTQEISDNEQGQDMALPSQSDNVSSEKIALNEDDYASLPMQRQDSQRWLRVKRGLPLVLGMTSVVAALSGGLLGYAFRVQDSAQLEQSPLFGNEIFGRDQEFPPSENWPGQKMQVEANPSILFERAPTQQVAQPAPERAGDIVLSDGIIEPESIDPQSEVPTAAPVVDRGLRYPAEIEVPNLQDSAPVDSGNITDRPTFSEQPLSEPSGPSKRAKPQDNTNTEENSSLSRPVIPQEGTPRIEEMPPIPEPSSQGPSSNVLPSNNNRASTSNRVAPTKQPKLLITPIDPPSVQNQGYRRDDTDISYFIPSFNQS